MFDKPFFTYLGMFIAVAAIVMGVIKPDWAVIAWTVASVLGYGSVAALRTTIDSNGWKTYAVGIVVLGLTIAQVGGFITPDVYQSLMVAFAPITGITMQQALAKSSASVPTMKLAA